MLRLLLKHGQTHGNKYGEKNEEKKKTGKNKNADIILLLTLFSRRKAGGNRSYLIYEDKWLLSTLRRLANSYQKVVLQHITQGEVRKQRKKVRESSRPQAFTTSLRRYGGQSQYTQ